MSEHRAVIAWQRAGEFRHGSYSRCHVLRFDDIVVAGTAAPGNVPANTGGPGVDPEQAFVGALSACHMLWFLHLACQKGWTVERYVDDAVAAETAKRIAEIRGSAEGREGIAAFLEKRKASWCSPRS